MLSEKSREIVKFVDVSLPHYSYKLGFVRVQDIAFAAGSMSIEY